MRRYGNRLCPQPRHVTLPEAVMLLPNKLTGVSWLRGISCPQTALSVSLSTLNKRNTTLTYATKKRKKKKKETLRHSPAATDSLHRFVNVLLCVCAWVSCLSEVWGSERVPLHSTVISRPATPIGPARSHDSSLHVCVCVVVGWEKGAEGGWREGERGVERRCFFVLIKFKYWFFLQVRYSACNVWFVDFVDFN